MTLNILLDNADPKIWSEYLPIGIFNGITTNPTLLKNANQKCDKQNINNLAKIAEENGCKNLHLQAWGESAKELFSSGSYLHKLNTKSLKVYVKIPITKEGVVAAKELISKNVSITFTGCYEAKQVLTAIAIGASFIAPYLGRINDIGGNGREEIVMMQEIISSQESNCNLLIASIREVADITFLASKGINTFTINHSTAEKLIHAKNTILAAKEFNKHASF